MVAMEIACRVEILRKKNLEKMMKIMIMPLIKTLNKKEPDLGFSRFEHSNCDGSIFIVSVVIKPAGISEGVLQLKKRKLNDFMWRRAHGKKLSWKSVR